MEFAILVFMALSCLGLVASILMLVTRQDLGRLRREVEQLNARLRRLEAERPAASREPLEEPAAAAAPPVAAAAPVAPPPRPRPPRPPRPARPAALDLEKLIGGQWLTWLGIIAIFLGTAFFLAYDLGASALAGLPQVLIAVLVAAVFLVIGRGLVGGIHRFLGLGLQGGGIALLYLVAYGLFGFHRLVRVDLVLPALLLVAIVGALAALWENSLTIAGLTLVGALATPLVLVGQSGWGAVLLPYLVAVDLGAVLAGRRRGWGGLPLGAFLGTFVLVTAWWDGGFSIGQRGGVLAVLTLMWGLFGVIPWLGRPPAGFWGLARTVLVAANGGAYSAAVYAALGGGLEAVRGGALLLIAVAYVTASLVGGRGRRDDPALVANFYAGAALLLLAVPVQFDGFTVSLAWALVGILLLAMGWRLRDPHHRLAALLGLAVAVLRIVLTAAFSGGSAAAGPPLFLNLGFAADAAVVILLLVASRIYDFLRGELAAWERSPAALLQPAAAALCWWIPTLEVARWALADRAGVPPLLSVPLVWAVYGLAVHWLGVRQGRAWLRGLALASLALAAVGSILQHAAQAFGGDAGWRPLLNAGCLAGVVTVAGLLTAWRRGRSPQSGPSSAERGLATPLLLIAHALILTLGSLEIAAWFRLEAAGFGLSADLGALVGISIFWTLYGGGLIWAGFLARLRPLRLAGMSLLALVILKVFLVDMRALSAGYRIVSFVVVGLLLLVISLLYQRERRTGGERESEDATP